MEIEIKMKAKITEQDIEDIIVTALEQGIGWWSCFDNTGPEYRDAPENEPVAITASKVLLSGGTLRLVDLFEENHEYEFNLNDLLNGIKTWKSLGYDTYDALAPGGLDCGLVDADAADCIIQCMIYGDIMYC